MFLAGDIGGTKTVLALFSSEHGPQQPLFEERFPSVEFDSFAEIVTNYLESHRVTPEAACFGIAGPVHSRRVQVTNLPWAVDAEELSQAMADSPVYLLNDLEAIATAIPNLRANDLINVKPGIRQPTGPIAILAPGTGLGEAFLFWDGNRYRAIPSEGGHTDFAPATELELALLSYFQPIMGHVSYERVCSGLGIPNLYRFLRDTGRYEQPEWLGEELASAADETPIIVESAMSESAPICVATLDLFLSILGSEAGNMVLKVLATGGVYLGGGIPPRIIDQLKKPVFLQAFTSKGRFTPLLDQVPVDVINNPKAALLGAATYCYYMLTERKTADF